MRITEFKLRNIIRRVIQESMDYQESLKGKMREIIFELYNDLQTCEEYKCLEILNMSISRMSDVWNQAGGNEVGYFVDACEIGQEMNRIQMMLYNNPAMSKRLLMRELDHVEGVIDACDFPELG